jgi:hypothetical protein
VFSDVIQEHILNILILFFGRHIRDPFAFIVRLIVANLFSFSSFSRASALSLNRTCHDTTYFQLNWKVLDSQQYEMPVDDLKIPQGEEALRVVESGKV